MIHLVRPPKFYIAFVSNFSWVLHVVQREIEDNLLMQNLGGETRCIMGDVQVANWLVTGSSP